MSPVKLFTSFKRAFSGIKIAFTQEQNFQIHCVFGVCVLIAAFLLEVSSGEWMMVFSAILFLLILELVNTAMERVVDAIQPRVHSYAAVIKDLMAGAVFLGGVMVLTVVVWVLGKALVQ